MLLQEKPKGTSHKYWMLKVCSQCGEEKPIGEFALLRRSKDGHRGYCKIHVGGNIVTNIDKLTLPSCLSVLRNGGPSTSSTTETIRSSTTGIAAPGYAPRYTPPMRLSFEPFNGDVTFALATDIKTPHELLRVNTTRGKSVIPIAPR